MAATINQSWTDAIIKFRRSPIKYKKDKVLYTAHVYCMEQP